MDTSKHNLDPKKTIKVGNIDFYLAPKCGTNTIRYAAYLYEGGKKIVNDVRDATYNILALKGGDVPYTSERRDSIKIVIKRDPVGRFQSALRWYNTKYDQNLSVEDAIENTPDDPHFYSQTHFYGNPSKYDRIIHMSQINDIIVEYTGKSFGKIHKGMQTADQLDLSPEQIDMIEEMYMEDYDNGYC